VVLDGIDGDNVISHGELYLKELVEAGDWAGFAHEVEAMERLFAGADHAQTFERNLGSPEAMFRGYAAPYLRDRAERGPWWRFLRDIDGVSRHFAMGRGYLLRFYWKRLVRPYPLLRLNRAWRARRRGRERPALPEAISPSFATRVGLAERLARFPSMEEQGLFGRSVRETQRHLLGSARLAYALAMTDHIGAMSSVEIRHPFMDKRLVEFCLALPARQSLRDGWTRLILRRALAYTLPEKVTWRVGKAWMTPSFERGLFDLDGERLHAALSEPNPLSPFINRDYIDSMQRQGRALPDKEQTHLAQLATLSFWLRKRFVPEDMTGHAVAPTGELRDADTPSGAHTALQ
jgi:asparagine synthase (glutamine-hydrolysing)